MDLFKQIKPEGIQIGILSLEIKKSKTKNQHNLLIIVCLSVNIAKRRK